MYMYLVHPFTCTLKADGYPQGKKLLLYKHFVTFFAILYCLHTNMSNGNVVLSSNVHVHVHVLVQHVPASSGHFLFCSFGDVSKIMRAGRFYHAPLIKKS